MLLEVDGATIETASEADIRAALAAVPSTDGIWWIHVEHADDRSIGADHVEGDRYTLTYLEGRDLSDAVRAVSRSELQDILLSFHADDNRWRQIVAWKPYEPKTSELSRSGRSALHRYVPILGSAFILLFFLFGLPYLSGQISRLPWDRIPLPSWLQSTFAQIAVGFFSLCVAIFLVALIVKAWEVQRAKSWPKAVGRIVQSEAGLDLVQRDQSSMPTNERVARIKYEYTVKGQVRTGTRISFAERMSEEDVDEALARYPAGKTVDVFYDPKKLNEAVLERDIPDGIGFGCLVAFLMGVAAVAGAIWLSMYGEDLISAVFPRAVVPLFAFFGVASAFVLLIAYSIGRQSLQARSWPTTVGTVTVSTVHSFTQRQESSSSSSSNRVTYRQAYMPVVEYTYKVGGTSYTSRSLKLDTQEAGSQAMAERIAARYPVGSIVKVLYDPKKPSRAALQLSFTGFYITVAVGLVLLAIALWASGLFSSDVPLQLGR